jgi:hypothetical protein
MPAVAAGPHNSFRRVDPDPDVERRRKMRSSMVRIFVVCTFVLIGGLAFSDEASACGRKCANVAAAGQPICMRCIEDDTSTADCRNSASACGCFFKICEAFSAKAVDEDATLASIFSETAEPAECSALPEEITAL